jgi:hypothetical protein
VEFDLLRNGVSVFTDVAHRPTLPVGDVVGAIALPDLAACDIGDLLSVNVTDVGPETGAATPPTARSAVGTVNTATSTVSSYNIPIPAGYAVGDLFVHALSIGVNTISALPSGWVDFLTGSSTPTPLDVGGTVTNRLYVIAKIAVSGESGAQTVTLSGASAITAGTVAIAAPNPVLASVVDDNDSATVATANVQVTVPAVTTTEVDELYLQIVAGRFTSGVGPSNAVLDGSLATLLSICTSRSAATNFFVGIGWKALPTITTYGSLVATQTPNTANWAARVFTLKGGASASPGEDVGLQLSLETV